MGGRRKKAAAPCLPSPESPNTPTKPCPPRRQPVVLGRPARSRGARCAEVAGGAAADCAAVCCCCPCGLLGLFVLAAVRIPARLCRRAYRRCKKRKEITACAARKKKYGGGADAGDAGATQVGLLGPRIVSAGDDDGSVGEGDFCLGAWPDNKSPSAEVSEMEMEMLAHFYGGGFWRTASQRET